MQGKKGKKGGGSHEETPAHAIVRVRDFSLWKWKKKPIRGVKGEGKEGLSERFRPPDRWKFDATDEFRSMNIVANIKGARGIARISGKVTRKR